MNILNKADILKNRPANTIDIDCPSMGGVVRIRAMSASLKDIFEQNYANLETSNGVTENIRACFLAHCIVGDDDQLLFAMSDLKLLGQQDGKDLDKLFTKARELSGFTNDDEDELKKN